MAEKAKEILSPAEAAQFLGVSLPTVRRRIADGTIPARQLGRLWRIRRADLERLVDPVARPRPRRPARGK